MRTKLVTVILLLVWSSFGWAKELSLCKTNEINYFSCEINSKKIVSICGSNNLTKTIGYLQYRFGVLGKDPELEYPAAQDHPSKHFIVYAYSGSKVGVNAIAFDRGKYRYNIFSTRSAFGYNGSGIIVEKNKKQISFLKCDLERPKHKLYMLEKIGLESKYITHIGPEM